MDKAHSCTDHIRLVREDETMISDSTSSNKEQISMPPRQSNSLTLLQAQNMALLDQVLNPDNNFLDEDAMMMEIDKISARDSGLRDYYNQQIQTGKYAYFENGRKRKREVSSQTESRLFAGGSTLSYPFYLSSSSSSCSLSSNEEYLNDDPGPSSKGIFIEHDLNPQDLCNTKEFKDSASQYNEIGINDSISQVSVARQGLTSVTETKSDSSSGDGYDQNKKALIDNRKKRQSSRRLTRGMARNIKDRKKEVKEARDLMGLEALVLASKEIEKEMKKLSQTKKSQKLNVKAKSSVRSSYRIKHKTTTTQTSLLKSKKDDDCDTLIGADDRKSQKSARSKSRSPSPTKKINKKNKTQETTAVKSKRIQKRNRSNDANEEEQVINKAEERKNVTPKKKRGSQILRKNINNDNTTSFLYAKLLLPTTGSVHKTSYEAKKNKDIEGTENISDSFSCQNYIEKKIRVIVDNKIFIYNSNNPIIKNTESISDIEKCDNAKIHCEETLDKEKLNPQFLKYLIDSARREINEWSEDSASNEIPSLHSDNLASGQKQILVSLSKDITSPSNSSKKSSRLHQSNDDDSYATALHTHLSQNTNQQNQISLNLLDWRRRQQWMPISAISDGIMPQTSVNSRKNYDFATPKSLRYNVEDLQPLHSRDKIDIYGSSATKTSIPRSLNTPNHSQPMDFLRRRHIDKVYANWCCQLVHCLHGSGRSNAHHEFFYSDIDKAWYNFNEYKVDVVKLGVPPDAKLTRREWSIIRQRIRKRPRRFSKSFIKAQLEKLERYRDSVRNIQTRDDAEPDFPYEVPAPIKIGAPVTAYNKKSRVLHRGIVLTHDPEGKRYMIQFERTELGCEFCPDTEVTSHGVPDMIRFCSDTAFDGCYMGGFSTLHSAMGSIPYGTAYGPLEGINKNQYQHDQRGIARALDPELVDANEKDCDNRTKKLEDLSNDRSSRLNRFFLPVQHSNQVINHRTSTLDIITERECLIKLISLLHAMIERKSQILDALNACYDVVEAKTIEHYGSVSTAACDVLEKLPENFKQHHAWLLANLDLTNQSLNAALTHVQIMYGKSYANRYHSRAFSHKRNQARFKVTKNNGGLDSNATPWLKNLIAKCVDAGRTISTCLSNQNVDKKPRHQYFENRLASVTGLLLALRLFQADPSSEVFKRRFSKEEEICNDAPIDRKTVHSHCVYQSLNEFLHLLNQSDSQSDQNSHYKALRAKGFLELRDALHLYQVELAACRGEIIV